MQNATRSWAEIILDKWEQGTGIFYDDELYPTSAIMDMARAYIWKKDFIVDLKTIKGLPQTVLDKLEKIEKEMS